MGKTDKGMEKADWLKLRELGISSVTYEYQGDADCSIYWDPDKTIPDWEEIRPKVQQTGRTCVQRHYDGDGYGTVVFDLYAWSYGIRHHWRSGSNERSGGSLFDEPKAPLRRRQSGGRPSRRGQATTRGFFTAVPAVAPADYPYEQVVYTRRIGGNRVRSSDPPPVQPIDPEDVAAARAALRRYEEMRDAEICNVSSAYVTASHPPVQPPPPPEEGRTLTVEEMDRIMNSGEFDEEPLDR